MIIYFSATGNCKYVASRIANQFSDRAVSIEKLDKNIDIGDDKIFGIVSPVNWWELPILVREFLEGMTVKSSRNPYTFIVATYGTSPGCTFADAKKILMKKGIRLNGGFSVKMPDNWTPRFDLSDPEKVEKQNNQAEKYIEEVIQHISNRSNGNYMQRRLPYIVRIITKPMLERERQTKSFYVENTCIACGLCEKQCPVQAIEIRGGKPVWVKEQCSLCLRCLHNCPKFAIQYGNGQTKKHGQYKNPHA